MNTYSSSIGGRDLLRLDLESTAGAIYMKELWAYSETANGGAGGPIIYRDVQQVAPRILPLDVNPRSPSAPLARGRVFPEFVPRADSIPAANVFDVPVSFHWHAIRPSDRMVALQDQGAIYVVAASAAPHTWGAQIVWEEE